MIEEVVDSEKEARKARIKTRFLWVIIILDLLLFGYAAYEIVMIIINFCDFNLTRLFLLHWLSRIVWLLRLLWWSVLIKVI